MKSLFVATLSLAAVLPAAGQFINMQSRVNRVQDERRHSSARVDATGAVSGGPASGQVDGISYFLFKVDMNTVAALLPAGINSDDDNIQLQLFIESEDCDSYVAAITYRDRASGRIKSQSSGVVSKPGMTSAIIFRERGAMVDVLKIQIWGGRVSRTVSAEN